MKIVIVGGGKVGEVLCSELSVGHDDVILIEKNAVILERMIERFDITGIVGNGASYDVLMEAGVATADIFIAASETDEVNIIAAILAKKIGVTHTIARVRNPEYSSQLNFVKESLGISLLINPELSAARDIARVLKYPSALSVESFVGNRVNLVEFEVVEGSALDGMSLKDFRSRFGTVIVCIIQRDDHIFIPSGDSFIQAGDSIHVTGLPKDMNLFLNIVRKKEREIKSTFIVGGGRITHYLLDLLKKSHITNRKVIEINPERCEQLSLEFPNTTVVHADGTNYEILDEELIDDYDSFVSLTGIDEENLIMSIYARRKGIKKVITKMSRTNILKVLNVNIKSIITPKQLIASEILQFIRSRANAQGSNIEALYRIADNQVEALQFRICANSPVANIPLVQLKTKDNLIIAFIVRKGELIFPNGYDVLQEGDRVIVITTEKGFNDIKDVLVSG